jgi:hypothetical protein
MAKTLIKTPFPTTAEVARKLGVSLHRVRIIERRMFGDSSAPSESVSRKNGRKAGWSKTIGRGRVPAADR